MYGRPGGLGALHLLFKSLVLRLIAAYLTILIEYSSVQYDICYRIYWVKSKDLTMRHGTLDRSDSKPMDNLLVAFTFKFLD